MNAYELADQLKEYAGNNGYSHNDYADTMTQSANMLRQQADEKMELTGKFVRLADENNCLKDRMAELEKQSEPVAVLEKDGSVVTPIYQDASPVYPEDKYPEKTPRRVKMLVDKSTLPIGTLFYTTPQTKPLPTSRVAEIAVEIFGEGWIIANTRLEKYARAIEAEVMGKK